MCSRLFYSKVNLYQNAVKPLLQQQRLISRPTASSTVRLTIPALPSVVIVRPVSSKATPARQRIAVSTRSSIRRSLPHERAEPRQEQRIPRRGMGNAASTTTTTTTSTSFPSTTSGTPVATMMISGAAGLTTDDQTNAAARRAQGEFVRGVSSARHWITDHKNDDPPLPRRRPSAAAVEDQHDEEKSVAESSSIATTTNKQQPTNHEYPPAAGRYHLYVAYNCPWCHRVLLARSLLGLEDVITVDVLYPNRSNDDEPMGGNLWKFCPEGQVGQNGKHTQFPECTEDTVCGGKSTIQEIYEMAGIMDQTSVPVLFDKHTMTVVNNESAEIVRMLATTAMKDLGSTTTTTKDSIDLYPADKAAQIDQLNDWIYKTIANGSYKAGFSSNQQVYETAYATYFQALDELNTMLAESTFLTGPKVTEADLRLFPPLFRHDPVYYNRFKLNQSYLWEESSYPHIWRWMGDMMALPGMESVSNAGYLAHCKQGYFGRTGNGTIPVGPHGYPECYKIRNWNPRRSSSSLSATSPKGETGAYHPTTRDT